MSASGVSAYIEYGKQSNFTTAVAVGGATRAFGMDQKITSHSINNNKIDLGDLNSVNIQKYAFGNFEGALGVEWVLSNPWWLDMVLGNSVDGGAGPFTHTYDDSKTVNAFTVEVGEDLSTDRVVQLQRLTARSITISAALNDTVKVRGDFEYGATPSTAGTTLDSSITTDDILFPYTYVFAEIENPSGTDLVETQSFELTINPNITHIREPNSFNSVNAYKGKLDLTGRFILSTRDNTWWNNVMARGEPTNNTLRMIFSNDDVSPTTDERTIQFTFTGLGLGTLNNPIDQYALITDEVPWTARDLTVVATNNTAVPP